MSVDLFESHVAPAAFDEVNARLKSGLLHGAEKAGW